MYFFTFKVLKFNIFIFIKNFNKGFIINIEIILFLLKIIAILFFNRLTRYKKYKYFIYRFFE